MGQIAIANNIAIGAQKLQVTKNTVVVDRFPL